MIPPRRGKARLADKVILNDKYVQFFFEMVEPHSFRFQAGQYVSIQVSPRGDRRPYSFCNSPDKEHAFELLVDLEPAGLGVTFLQNLTFGDEVDVLAPMGVFTMSDATAEDAVAYVATGAGIAPFKSMILDQLQRQNDQREITLYWGLRHENTLFWQDEFVELSDTYPNFHFHPVISKATPEWPLCRGRVTDCLKVHQQLPKAGYYICGSTPMVEDVTQILTQMNVGDEYIHHERFY